MWDPVEYTVVFRTCGCHPSGPWGFYGHRRISWFLSGKSDPKENPLLASTALISIIVPTRKKYLLMKFYILKQIKRFFPLSMFASESLKLTLGWRIHPKKPWAPCTCAHQGYLTPHCLVSNLLWRLLRNSKQNKTNKRKNNVCKCPWEHIFARIRKTPRTKHTGGTRLIRIWRIRLYEFPHLLCVHRHTLPKSKDFFLYFFGLSGRHLYIWPWCLGQVANQRPGCALKKLKL